VLQINFPRPDKNKNYTRAALCLFLFCCCCAGWYIVYILLYFLFPLPGSVVFIERAFQVHQIAHERLCCFNYMSITTLSSPFENIFCHRVVSQWRIADGNYYFSAVGRTRLFHFQLHTFVWISNLKYNQLMYIQNFQSLKL